jgi:glutamate-1-semialdehyde 2,1-aminomutase
MKEFDTNMHSYPKSAQILEHNRRYIPGGVVSVNRATQPEIVFQKAVGAHLWDAEGNRYIDYHAAFAPYILGHNDPGVNAAVEKVFRDGLSLFGSGTTELEGQLAELVCKYVPCAQSVQFLNSGSEATYQAIRLSRAVTGRDDIIVMQGGYNGWHNDVACNLMTPLNVLGPRVSPGEYPFLPISAGIPKAHQTLVHPVNYNDLTSVRRVCETHKIACLITEPILQNIGVVHPEPGYLAGLKALANEFGFVLIFDEVKTGFRHAIGGYESITGVTPDLALFGKALANGYPIAAIAGRADLMDYFVHPDAAKRVLLAGTYNAHPVPTAAAIATIERLAANDGEVYRHGEALGARLQNGAEKILQELGITSTVARQGSALCIYFMDHQPKDWYDLAANHRFDFDAAMRVRMIDRGVYFFPTPTKQCSISAAHTEADIDTTLEILRDALSALLNGRE